MRLLAPAPHNTQTALAWDLPPVPANPDFLHFQPSPFDLKEGLRSWRLTRCHPLSILSPCHAPLLWISPTINNLAGL